MFVAVLVFKNEGKDKEKIIQESMSAVKYYETSYHPNAFFGETAEDAARSALEDRDRRVKCGGNKESYQVLVGEITQEVEEPKRPVKLIAFKEKK